MKGKKGIPMEAINVYKRPRLNQPYFIACWPGMGEVAFKAGSFLVESLKAVEFAELSASEFFYFTSSITENGVLRLPELPLGKFFYWKNPVRKASDMVIFLSTAQPDLLKAEDYCQKIIALAKSFHAKEAITFAAMPQAIDHTQMPNVWAAATTKEMAASISRFNINLLNSGQISGMNGLFLGIAKKHGLEGACLLGEVPLYTIHIENPKASHAVLEALNTITGINLDISGLLAQGRNMEEEINKLMESLHLPAFSNGPIGEEDIEKIKRSLSQLTKLPESITEKIENLFNEARLDIKKAQELKVELDRWNVYKDYEDRFLDLFKKQKEGNN